MNSEVIGGLVRHILTAVGGFFVAKGVVDADTLTTVVSAIATLIGTGWSIWAKLPKST